ncbi:unnamed protein product, partial [Phaeothamnion confervicola]
LWQPALDPSEWPERRDVVTDAQLDAFATELAARGFERARAPRPPPPALISPGAAGATAAASEEDGAFGSAFAISLDANALTAAAVAPIAPPAATNLPDAADAEGARVAAAAVEGLAAARRVLDPDAAVTGLPAVRGARLPTSGEPSALEAEEHSAKVLLLRDERRTLLTKTAADVLAFDEAVYDLRRERLLLNGQLAAAELSLLVRRQEVDMLRQFDAQDAALAAQLERCTRDKAEVVAAVADCTRRLQAKRAEMDTASATSAAIAAEFAAAVPEVSPWHAVLLRILRRRAKRSRRRVGEVEDDDDSDEEESESEGDEDSEEEDAGGAGGPDGAGTAGGGGGAAGDACPVGCDAALHERVLKLRVRRHDAEEAMAELQRATDDLRRTLDRQVTRQRQIDKDLTAAEREERALRAEKQARVNEFDVVLALRLDQLNCLAGGDGGGDSGRQCGSGGAGRAKLVAHAAPGRHVVFLRAGLARLRRRTVELAEETKAERANFKELQREKARLERATVEREAEQATLAARCDELQRLKFGQLIDLDALDRGWGGGGGGTGGGAIGGGGGGGGIMSEEEVSRRVAAIEAEQRAALGRLAVRGRRLDAELLQKTVENTALLSQIAELSARQLHLERALNNGGGGSASGTGGGGKRAEEREREKLVRLVKVQAQELDAIKGEINFLRCK